VSEDDIGQSRYAAMRWNTPLSEEHAALLLARLDPPAGATIVDLGCGWGELLVRAVAAAPGGASGTGVDSDESLLERGRALAAGRGLEGMVEFVSARAEEWDGVADRLLCVGASHAWGGSAVALEALYRRAKPGGRLLFGDGCWEQPPTAAAARLFDEVLSLEAFVAAASAAGWRVLSLTTADQREWDDFESTWRAGREEWLLARPGSSQAAQQHRALDDRLAEYLSVYRGVLGFCYLILARPAR